MSKKTPGLEFINQLRPVTYHLDMDRIASTFHYEDSFIREEEAKIGAMLQRASSPRRWTKRPMNWGMNSAEWTSPRTRTTSMPSPLRRCRAVPLVKAAQELSAQSAAQQEEIESQKEEIRTQRKTIDALMNRLDRLEGIVNGCCNVANSGAPATTNANEAHDTSLVGNAATSKDRNRLDQNAPNPFHENSVIRYYVAEQAPNTYLRIVTIEGIEMARYPIEHQGEGQITIMGNTLSGSLYLYELIVDSEMVASRKMVLTR
ncbi:MAG: hypothetical protein U0176_09865 [Bacteroidia bacterium]